MLFSTTISCLLAISSPQEPATARPTEGSTQDPAAAASAVSGTTPGAGAAMDPNLGLVTYAGYFPSTTLAAVSMPAVAPHRIGLMRSGLDDVLHWVGPSWQQSELLTPLTLGPLPAASLPDSGFSLGITGVSAKGVKWILVVPSEGRALDLRKEITDAHKVLEKRRCEVSVRLVGVDQAWTVTDPNGHTISYVITDKLIFLGDSVASIEGAVAQSKDEASSLLRSGSYNRFCEKCTPEGSPFLTLFTQPQVGVAMGLDFLPSLSERQAVQKIIGKLELDRMSELGISFFAQEGRLNDFTWIGFPKPREGVLGTVLAGDGPVQTKLLQNISPDAIAATLFTIDFEQLLTRSMGVVETLHPSIRDSVNKTLATLANKSGLDLAKDILPLLSSQGTYQEFATVNHTRVRGLTVELKDASQMRKVLARITKAYDLPRGVIEAIPATSIPGGFGPGRDCLITVHKNTLIVGSSARFLHRIVSLLEAGIDPELHQLAEPLRRQSTLPNLFHWGDCAGVGWHWMRALSNWAGHRLVADGLARMVIARGGTSVSSIHSHESGLVVRSGSPFSNIYLTLGAAYLVKLSELEAKTGPALSARRLSAVRDILAAQRDFQGQARLDTNGNGKGEFAKMPELIRSGLISARWFDNPNRKVFEVEEYRFRIYTPRRAPGREEKFLLLAWPKPQTSGLAYAATEDGTIYANKIIGQTGNLRLCDPRDFFANGEFDAEVLPAWALLETRMGSAMLSSSGAGLEELTDDEKLQMDLLTAAQSSGAVSAEVAALLSAENPIIVSQAAVVLGNLRHRGSVTALCEKVRSHADVHVKRNAMAALCRIRDKQSIPTSIEALSSQDSELRTHAAKNLGYLHATQSTRQLLDVLAADPTPNAPDRIAALLALADIGRPDCLLPAAARVKSTGREEQSALVYLFQTLSPKLGTSEAEVMIAVLDDDSELLRRYSIQRLGVLRAPIAEAALRARLPHETTLRGIIEVSLKVMNEEKTTSKLKDYVATAERRGRELWNSLPAHFAYGVFGGGVLLLILSLSIRRRRSRARNGDRLAAMVAPSDEFEEGEDYEDEDYEDDLGDEEYEDAEFAPSRYGKRGRRARGKTEESYDPGYDDEFEGDEHGYMGDDPFDDYYADGEIITDERDLHS